MLITNSVLMIEWGIMKKRIIFITVFMIASLAYCKPYRAQLNDNELTSIDQRLHNALLYQEVGDMNEAVRLIREDGANVNSSDYSGWTPIMLAALFCNNPSELVRLGADLSAENDEGDRALDIAELYNCDHNLISTYRPQT